MIFIGKIYLVKGKVQRIIEYGFDFSILKINKILTVNKAHIK